MRRKFRKLAVAVAAGAAAVSLSLTGCSSAGTNNTSSGPSPTLRVWAGSQTPIPQNFNPFSNDLAVHATYGAIYESLFFFNALTSDDPKPMLGESYDFSEDGKTLTIKLKQGLKWNDGSPITAEDVAFTFDYGSNKNEHLLSSKAVDESTTVLTFDEPQFTREPLLLGGTWIIPKKVWEPIKDFMNEPNKEPIGSGPYMLDKFSDAAYTVKANPNFRDGEVELKNVQYVGLNSNQSAQDLLTTGKIDWVGQFIANPKPVLDKGDFKMLNNPQNPTTIITCADVSFGCKGAQTDPAVRQAINVAIDRKSISEKAFAGLPGKSNPAMMLLPRDEQWLADPANGESPQSANAAEAGRILEAAGYAKGADGLYGKDGKKIELDLFSPDGWTDYNDAAKLIAESAQAAGIKINYRTVSDAEYWTPIQNGQFQLALWGLTQSIVADPFTNYFQYYTARSTAKVGESPTHGQNYARYTNAKVDQAVETAAGTRDADAKKAAYKTIQEEISRDLPYIPVVLNASQVFFNTEKFTGWPSDSDLYANPVPYSAMSNAVVLAKLKPAK